ncbi:hypothetical protein GLYMA_12G225600v4 [Glycine max]|uniref:protein DETOXIFICATION 18 isoform X1 n=1 Tax=Glycine max TaxID=3847 RepID=UPI000719216B|nr:protein DETOXIFICATION 18 isoform X1 [Glycine max]KAG4386099.1 hypothetical protein GLYMA_12G225600v4 [Glycine max]KAG4386100.1 hypothetical protein GLYMA_12G225600v4 [Glycine max]KAG4386101.1 hypothetical protein GLYMA_12G225600v4 [Glycine max]KAG4386102.1 hypothetical protein GLYMA_12G225600v4 [Glycine max]KAH1144446.1 hypothetical protein GYH30_034603 [Glycine max]|eukprot:XP_014620572.1 protein DETOXIFICATION 18 isoform X1 [Glycine max]
MLGIYLQGSCIISLIFSIIISIIWFYTEPILVLLHQSPDIARTAALYMKFLIPGVFAYSFLQNISRFLQTQSVVMPLVALSALPLLIHIGIAYGLVQWPGLSFAGMARIFNAFIPLRIYKHETGPALCCNVWSIRLLVLVFLAGLLPDSQITTSLIAICLNTQFIAHMVPVGLGAAERLVGRTHSPLLALLHFF